MIPTCNLQLSNCTSEIQTQAAIDMANVLLVFGYHVNLVIASKEKLDNAIAWLNHTDTQLIDTTTAVVLTQDGQAPAIPPHFSHIELNITCPSAWQSHAMFANTTLHF